MNKYIETIKDKIKNNNELLKQIPNWEIEDFKTYYETYMPELMASIYGNRLSKEKLERIINERIQEELAIDIEIRRVNVQDSILEEIQELELFLKRYFICCREYGKEIDITDSKDIIVDHGCYTLLYVPKVNLSLLCDKDDINLVLKKDLFGNSYTWNSSMNGLGFYELTSSAVLFYPTANDEAIMVGPYDSRLKKYIGCLHNNLTIPCSEINKHLYDSQLEDGTGDLDISPSMISRFLFNELRREVMIDDYDYHRLGNPLKDILGILPRTATIYKTIKSKEIEGQTTVAYLINLDDGTIRTDIVDISSGKRYELDKSIAQRDAINKVYETVLLDLEQKNNSNNNRVLVPKIS